MANCPRINNAPWKIARDFPAFMFAPACAAGGKCEPIWGRDCCIADQIYWTVVVPWNQFLSEGWIAPGGNKYWSKSIPADSGDPVAVAILRLMAARSQSKFDVVGRSKQLMHDFMAQNVGKWATSFGMLSIAIQPDPNETADAFRLRGGYLLWVDPKEGPFSGKLLQSYWSAWLGPKVESAEIWGAFDPAKSVITYTIRLDYKESFDNVAQSISNGITNFTKKFCEKATSPEAMTAAAAASAIPAAQPYVAAWGAASALCNWPPAAPCEISPDNSADAKKPTMLGPLLNLPKKYVLTLPTNWAPPPSGIKGGQQVASTAGQMVPQINRLAPIPLSPNYPRPDIEGLPWHRAPTTKIAASVGVLALVGGLVASLLIKN